MNTTTEEKSIQIDRKFPESIAKILLSSGLEELKGMIVTENGFTIAEEERMLREEQEDIDSEDEEDFKSPEATIKDLRNMIEKDERN